MEYFTLLKLKKEPFSNSPDPELFFHSNQHQNCLQKLEIALRLRRGLSVVIGDIGTGKSTLSRQLVRMIDSDNKKILSHLILDPEFTSPKEFLTTIIKTFNIDDTGEDSEWQLKENIKTYLFKQGVDLDTVPTLIIDEGQKLPDFCIEILREFLNYETNQHKLLQIIIFAQKEFKEILKKKANFADRITTLQHLSPLNLKETRQMIQFRIEKSQEDQSQKIDLFSPAAFFGIYYISGGYPRKIVMLCSKIIFNMLVKNKKKAGLGLVFSSARETSFPVVGITKRAVGVSLVIAIALAFLIFKLKTPPVNSNIATQAALTFTQPVNVTASEQEENSDITKALLPALNKPNPRDEESLTSVEEQHQKLEEPQQTPLEAVTKSTAEQNSIPGRFPEASTRLLSESDLFNINLRDLKIMRNEVFARHSYIFTSEEMIQYFAQQSWYTGTSKKVDKKLSKIELANLSTIRSYERKLQQE